MPGRLIRPPYKRDEYGNWGKAGGQPAGSVTISTTQYDPLESRRGSANPLRKVARRGKKRKVLCNDTEIERWLDRRMSLLPDERAACEDARKQGRKSFKAIQGSEGKIPPKFPRNQLSQASCQLYIHLQDSSPGYLSQVVGQERPFFGKDCRLRG